MNPRTVNFGLQPASVESGGRRLLNRESALVLDLAAQGTQGAFEVPGGKADASCQGTTPTPFMNNLEWSEGGVAARRWACACPCGWQGLQLLPGCGVPRGTVLFVGPILDIKPCVFVFDFTEFVHVSDGIYTVDCIFFGFDECDHADDHAFRNGHGSTIDPGDQKGNRWDVGGPGGRPSVPQGGGRCVHGARSENRTAQLRSGVCGTPTGPWSGALPLRVAGGERCWRAYQRIQLSGRNWQRWPTA